MVGLTIGVVFIVEQDYHVAVCCDAVSRGGHVVVGSHAHPIGAHRSDVGEPVARLHRPEVGGKHPVGALAGGCGHGGARGRGVPRPPQVDQRQSGRPGARWTPEALGVPGDRRACRSGNATG